MKKSLLLIASLLFAGHVGAQETISFTVDATNCNWVSTNITINAGDRIKVEQTGGSWSCDKLHHKLVSADGHTDENTSGLGQFSQYKTMKSAFFGSLLAKVDSHILNLGANYDNSEFPYSGTLYLKINDESCGDNGGMITVSISRFAKEDLSRGLIAYYPFNNQATDESGGGRNGSVYGDPKTVISGRTGDLGGKAMEFDGVDDYIRITNESLFNTSSTTIAFWIKPASFVGIGNDAIIDKPYTSHTSPYYQIHFGITGDKYGKEWAGRFQFYYGAANYNTSTNYWTPNTWYFILMSYDISSQVFAIYINNSEVYKTVVKADIKDYGKDIYIGRSGNLNYFTPFTLDELRFYTRALSSAERTALYKK